MLLKSLHFLNLILLYLFFSFFPFNFDSFHEASRGEDSLERAPETTPLEKRCIREQTQEVRDGGSSKKNGKAGAASENLKCRCSRTRIPFDELHNKRTRSFLTPSGVFNGIHGSFSIEA